MPAEDFRKAVATGKKSEMVLFSKKSQLVCLPVLVIRVGGTCSTTMLVITVSVIALRARFRSRSFVWSHRLGVVKDLPMVVAG